VERRGDRGIRESSTSASGRRWTSADGGPWEGHRLRDGKSGLIARKIAATLASPGPRHSSSNPRRDPRATSGWSALGRGDSAPLQLGESTEEISPPDARLPADGPAGDRPHGGRGSTLGRYADVWPRRGGCGGGVPLGWAPHGLDHREPGDGDALAVVLSRRRGSQREDFAKLHPAAPSGRHLQTISDLDAQGGRDPARLPGDSPEAALSTISAKRWGDRRRRPRRVSGGIITDGDVRRVTSAAVDHSTPTAAPS